MTGLHTLKRMTKRKAARVGRGGKRGKTSGKGHKGQKSRAGGKPRPELRDTIKKVPKKRGYGKNRARTINSGKLIAIPVSLSKIDVAFGSGETVSPKTLSERGIISSRGKKTPYVKILANGEINTKILIEGCKVSKTAREAIEKAGGSIV
ncbi:50S ribosomal protein L15 [Candidatus Kaiserbacteria bacterium CG10_big_fil_rev_8_21_14_0_10_43_70]|uniref:Large ribosomal subunit protein uL15 n=1 Tax=Candidatus Kaiserbacteria bacterium CG10_big_fil_rev_8_21_14_0_10_43_70 TaxID=1974605 RepID=A0A2H0UJG0_9BACT|nr:MAG: 50S ribosomal protein L15 [Candidatus Kaiserbacteria bacterium CG10_big_fil_rev_8_21_14_0_10_43_70]